MKKIGICLSDEIKPHSIPLKCGEIYSDEEILEPYARGTIEKAVVGVCSRSFISQNHFSNDGHYIVTCMTDEKAPQIVEAINKEPGFFAKIIDK